MVYALVVLFVNSGRGDEHQVAEWIHKAHRFSQRRNPLLGLVSPLERMLQAPDAFLPAFEPLLDDEDPWVRALARLQLGKMWIMLGQGGRDADAYLEMALAEFRALGERWGISFALTELADRIATRGEFAGASSQGAVGPRKVDCGRRPGDTCGRRAGQGNGMAEPLLRQAQAARDGSFPAAIRRTAEALARAGQ